MTLIGAHAPNSPFGAKDFGIIGLMGAQTVKLLDYHTAEDVARLRSMGIGHFTARLPDSVWDGPTGEYIPSYWDYGDRVAERAHYWASLGVMDGQLDCEPNITWPMHALGPWDYRAFLSNTVEYVRPLLPRGFRLGFPPMSFADAYKPMDWLGPMRDTVPYFDFCCVNSYWQSSRQGRTNIMAGPMRWSNFGANAEWYHAWQPDMPLQVVEWGNSIHEQGVWRPDQVDAFRREQYPLYIEWLRTCPYIEAAHVFIVGGVNWQGFEVTPSVAAAVRGAIMPGPGQDTERARWRGHNGHVEL